MIQWLISNAGTIAVLIVLLIIVALALRTVIKRHKCGASCAGCASSGTCPHCKL